MKTGFFNRRLLRSKRTAASATLVGLLIVFVASFVLAGWAMMLAARVESAELAPTSMKRRIAIQNSRNVAIQWARNGLTNDSVTATTVILANDWGQFTAADTRSDMLGSTNTNAVFNHFGPLGIGGYVQQFTVALVVTNYSATNRVSFRSRSPIFGGYPFVGQSNASLASPSFARMIVVTNSGGMAMMFATNSTANAAIASAYSSPVNRVVVDALNSLNIVSPISLPFPPTASTDAGANALNGTMTTYPLRATNMNFPSVMASTNTNSYGTNVPVLNDTIGDFRVVGAVNTYGTNNAAVSTFQVQARNVNANRFVLINTITGSTNTTSALSFGTNSYEISTTGDYLRMRRGSGSWVDLQNTNQYLLVNSTGGNPVRNTKPSDRITMRSGTNSSFILMAVAANELVALQGNYVTFSYPGLGPAEADNPAVVNGAVLYRDTSYGVNGGIGFVLLGANRTGAALNAMSLFTPTNQIRIRALVNGLPLVQVNPATSYSIQSSSGVNALGFQLTNATRLRVLANTTNSTPLLIHAETARVRDQNNNTISGDPHWRKVLLVMNHTNTVNINTNSSALTFSYLDEGNFDMGVEDANSTRPIFLSVLGHTITSTNSDISFQGPHNRTWQLGMTVRDANTTFNRLSTSSSAWTIQGGLRSNGSMQITSSTFRMNLTSVNAPPLEEISDRVGWVEFWQE